MHTRNRVVQLAHNSDLSDVTHSIISNSRQLNGRDLVMIGVSLRTGDCESCSQLFDQIDAEIKRRGLTWNSY